MISTKDLDFFLFTVSASFKAIDTRTQREVSSVKWMKLLHQYGVVAHFTGIDTV